MGKEIERKFLVNKEKWQVVSKPKGEFVRQGYILTDPKKTIRVRIKDDKAFLAIKGLSIGATRSEYEYEIPIEDAKELIDNFSISELSKIRYTIAFNGCSWEIDEFLNDNLGLIVTEIELTSEDEKFDLPEWVGQEVTGNEKYYNSNLTTNPYKNWDI